MGTFYLAVLVIGVALAMISFLTGVAGHSFGHVGDVGHGVDVGHGAHTGEAHGDHGQRAPFLNVGTITAFMTWFGGVGFLVATYSQVVGLGTVVLALGGGLAAAAII